MKAYAVIPARYGSTRLPGKCILPEAKAVTGKYIIEHVYSRTKEAKRIEGVVVATDDQRIYDVVKGFGGCAKMTSPSHNSGTERVAEVVKDLDSDIDIIVNVQGDEPEVRPDMVDTVVAALINDPKTVMSTLANPIISRNELNNPHAVKVVMYNNGYALYFSRSPIPYSSNFEADVSGRGIFFKHLGNILHQEIPPIRIYPQMFKENSPDVSGRGIFFKHLGIYAYRRDFLMKYVSLP